MNIKEIKKHFSDKYEILSLLGKGGFAEVYLAEDKILERKVAIKILLTEHSNEPEMVKRFIREAKLYAKLEHENLINIYDTGIIGENAYIIMKYVKGANLKSYIGSDRKTIGRILPNLIRSMGNVLSYIHANGIIHRDIKPANILIEEGTDKIYLADFGIARSVSSKTLTQSGSIMGTPYYISPEQIKGKKIDSRTDIYALGATLYEFVSGKPIFTAESSVEILYKHVNTQPVPISKAAPFLSKEEKYIITKCLEKNPEKRFPDAKNIASLIEGRKSQKITKYLESVEDRSNRGRKIFFLALFLIAVIALTLYFTILKPPPREINGPENEKKVVKKTIPKEQNLIVKKGESEHGIKSKIKKKEETSEPKKSEPESQSKKNEKEKVKNVSANPPLKKAENNPKKANTGISTHSKNTSIQFSSFPASDVYWNGIKLGNTTQVFKKKFPPGTYTFTFKIEGYESKERVIIVKDEKELTAHYKFRPFGFLTLTAKPFAEFFINNKSFGTNPIFQKKLPAGSYIIEAVKPGYKKERREINIKPLKKSFINFTMKKEEK